MVEDHPPAQPERTPGTETSQYREEEKETIDTLSRGDRKGQSLNRRVQGHGGVVGAVKGISQGTGSAWKRAAKRVKRPYRQRGRDRTAT